MVARYDHFTENMSAGELEAALRIAGFKILHMGIHSGLFHVIVGVLKRDEDTIGQGRGQSIHIAIVNACLDCETRR